MRDELDFIDHVSTYCLQLSRINIHYTASTRLNTSTAVRAA